MFIKSIGAISLIAGSALAADYQWLAWKQQHQKSHSGVEETQRYTNFVKNREYVKKHNDEAAEGRHTFTLGMNKFADLTVQEFEAQYNAPVVGQQFACPELYAGDYTVDTLPESCDWRYADQNDLNVVAVTAVKDQGSCGSCWTFGAVGTMEGGVCMSGQYDCATWDGLSEQEMLNCASYNSSTLGVYDNNGCGGGEQSNGIRWVFLNGGITDEATLPYLADTSRKTVCENPNPVAGTTDDICGTTSYNGPDALLLAGAILDKGPVTVGIDAGGIEFQLYSGGVYSSSACSARKINHAVTTVGYGNQDSMDFWTVKNSWGTGWGLSGYILMERGVNMCGIEQDTQYSLMADW